MWGMAIDVCIRGAGVVGKTLALLLARARIRVGLVQTAAPQGSAPDIRAFALNAASQALLHSVRAWPDDGCAVQHMRVQGDEAASVQFDATAQGVDALAWIVDASALEQRLQTALSFAPEITLLTAPEPAALTVICEGRHSLTRDALGIELEQQPYHQSAIAALLTTANPHQATAWQWMQGANSADGASEDPHSGEVCALLPRGASMAGNSVALVWSVHHDRVPSLIQLDDAQFAAAVQQACGNALGAMTLSSARATWPLHMAQASRWVGQGLGAIAAGLVADPQAAWVLAGDAAHAVHPLAGQGLNLGLGDAAELARVLAAKEYFRSYGDQRLLRRYERARKGDAAALRLATDGLQRLFAWDDPRVRAVRNWGMRGFDAIAPLKSAVMQRAMGRTAGSTPRI
jgi:2-polyprenyl-6-methoxyphenol hydroxylase-like FAD-dependent oxidoreductase